MSSCDSRSEHHAGVVPSAELHAVTAPGSTLYDGSSSRTPGRSIRYDDTWPGTLVFPLRQQSRSKVPRRAAFISTHCLGSRSQSRRASTAHKQGILASRRRLQRPAKAPAFSNLSRRAATALRSRTHPPPCSETYRHPIHSRLWMYGPYRALRPAR